MEATKTELIELKYLPSEKDYAVNEQKKLKRIGYTLHSEDVIKGNHNEQWIRTTHIAYT